MKTKLVSLKKCGFYTKENIKASGETAKALLRAREMLPAGHNFKIWSGYRSPADQKKTVQWGEKKFKKE